MIRELRTMFAHRAGARRSPFSRALVPAVLLAAALAAPPVQSAEARLPRHPAPSPDGSQVAFSWQGDLWVVPAIGGTARRLTAHAGADRHPVWSRDGRHVAFASHRHGSADVFVMPADASEPPRRLTFASTDELPLDFDVAGERVLFASRRDESMRRGQALYEVPVAGGTPALADPALAQWAVWSPSGTTLAMVRGGTYWWRTGYRGAANRDVWLRRSDGRYEQVTHFAGDDDTCGWVDEQTLVVLSGRERVKNLHRVDIATGTTTPLTDHRDTGARWPRLSADGRLAAYEQADGIWVVRTDGGEPRRLSIDVPADPIADPVTWATERAGASELAVSPDGKTAAFVLDADVFVVPVVSKQWQEVAPPRTVQVTATPGREQDIAWSPDGERLVFSSDRRGQPDLWVARPAAGAEGWSDALEFDVEPLVASPEPEERPRWSPDGERIGFVRGRGQLVVADADGKNERVVLDHWYEPEWRWSPDGRFIACSMPDVAFNSEVFVLPVDGGEPYNVSRHPDDDGAPAWSPDGHRLVWISKRHADTLDVWSAWLTREAAERQPEDWLRYWEAEAAAKKAKKKAGVSEEAGAEKDEQGEETAPDALPEVEIDFDGLWERAEPLTTLAGDEARALVTPDGRRILFVGEHEGERDLYSVRFDGQDIQRLTRGGQSPRQLQLADEEVFFLDGDGRIQRVAVDGKAGDPVPFTARYRRERAERQAAVFDEAHRTLAAWFYDPDMHGVEWDAVGRTYRPWALAASHQLDFADVMNLMLGELNASHMGYRMGGKDGPEETGFIGALFDPQAGGPGVLVREVLDDSPGARTDVRLQAGDRLLRVGSVELGPGVNVYRAFAGTIGQPVPITIQPADGETRTAVVTPVPFREQRQRRYETWVEQRRRLVERLSAGRLGYIHVQAMGMESFEEFEQALHSAAEGKEGLIIDVRSNGGGWTTDYLMAVLDVRRHAYTIPRGAPADTRAYPQGRLPLAAWTRPALALCDEESYSNAEIFSWAFQNLGLGRLVGTPTFGAVISTGGTRLLDGALLRLPFRGWFVAGTGTNMENHGAVPDVVVDRPPAEDTAADRDTQLERAVAVFLEDIESDPRYGSW